MTPSIVAVLAVGGLLGLRHAFEPDHLAAVSTLATRGGPGARLWSAGRLGLIWGLGHSATVGIVVLLIIALQVQLPPELWPAAELVVAGLLVILGANVIWRYARGRWHMHVHSHRSSVVGHQPPADSHLHLHSHVTGAEHAHEHSSADAHRSLGFGVAHGLAGSGAIAALLVAAVPDATSRIFYFLAFSAGTTIGMLGVSLTLAAVVRMAASKGARLATLLHLGAAVVSVAAGLVLAVQVVRE
jgi:hypothetical protein